MQAEEDAELIIGFNQKVEKESYTNHLNNSTLSEILNIEKVINGNTYYIPTGRVHAIGAGVLLAEIQQTSDVTYRIYDYDRVDKKTGKKRELHTDLAVDAIDFEFCDNYKTTYNNQTNISNELIHTSYFKTNIINVKGEMIKHYTDIDSFVIYICVDGYLEIEYKNKTFTLNKGETLLLPAIIDQIKLKSDAADILEVSL